MSNEVENYLIIELSPNRCDALCDAITYQGLAIFAQPESPQERRTAWGSRGLTDAPWVECESAKGLIKARLTSAGGALTGWGIELSRHYQARVELLYWNRNEMWVGRLIVDAGELLQEQHEPLPSALGRQLVESRLFDGLTLDEEARL